MSYFLFKKKKLHAIPISLKDCDAHGMISFRGMAVLHVCKYTCGTEGPQLDQTVSNLITDSVTTSSDLPCALSRIDGQHSPVTTLYTALNKSLQ